MVATKRKKDLENYVLKTKESIEALVYFTDDQEELSFLGMLLFEASKNIFGTLYTPAKAKQVMLENLDNETMMEVVNADKVRTSPNVGSDQRSVQSGGPASNLRVGPVHIQSRESSNTSGAN